MLVGIDIGGTNVAIGLVEDGKIIKSKSIKTVISKDYTEIIKNIAININLLVMSAEKELHEIEAIGIGVPGTPDNEFGIVTNIFNISNMAIPFRDELKKYFDVDIYIENDARCAALGEFMAGISKGLSNVIMITLGTGVGCGIIINKKLYSGLNNAAGEFGHTTIVPNGHLCKCGNRGCFEKYAATTGLIRIARDTILQNTNTEFAKQIQQGAELDGKFIFDMAHMGDVTALKIIKQYTIYVAMGVTNLVNIFAPEMIVIGGGISEQGEYFIEPIREYVKNNAFVKNAPIARIEPAMLGNDAGIIGASMLKSMQ